ncbi:MAG: hypothetical protein ACXWQO_10730 [Bdellovibrionota bacterium]
MRLLKIGYLLWLATLTSPAFALPVLNASTPGAEMITVFPDHIDKTLHYLAPTVFVVAKDASGIPNFSYMEYVSSSGYRRAILQTTLRPDFTYEAIEKAKSEIRKIQPQAQFAALAFEDTKVSFTDSLRDLLISSDCQHQAGTVADEQTCAFKLSERGIKVMLPMLKRGLLITTQFLYTINGVRQNADGTYQNQKNQYQVAGRIGGPELAKYPELFRGADGRAIPDDQVFPGKR